MSVRIVWIGDHRKFTLSVLMRKIIDEQIELDDPRIPVSKAYVLNMVAEQFTLSVIASTHPHNQKRINAVGAWLHPLVSLLNPSSLSKLFKPWQLDLTIDSNKR